MWIPFQRLATLLAVPVFSFAPLAAQQRLDVQGVEAGGPVAVTASLDAAAPELVVEVAIDDGWHLYARDVGGGQPVALEVAGGSSFAADGALRVPDTADGTLHGEVRLVLPLRRVADGDALMATLRYMACDPLMCLPPQEVTLAAAPMRVLLVVTEPGARAERIATFLTDRGLQCTVRTYADVAAADCEAHDVVVADSPYFKEAGKHRKAAAAFPETPTPVVAVGFLGTVLLEANRIAMACGYI